MIIVKYHSTIPPFISAVTHTITLPFSQLHTPPQQLLILVVESLLCTSGGKQIYKTLLQLGIYTGSHYKTKPILITGGRFIP